MIKATFPAGVDQITIHGLHQWDYGQVLEIEAPGLPSIVEVHFACAGMTEAVVRTCDVAVATGRLTAVIPDECLEQASTVVAWVYRIGLTEGETVLTVLMPVIPRTRPAQEATEPTIIEDKYTQLIDAVNEQVMRLSEGDVLVANALAADNAQSAQSAERAEWAALAEDANHADHAVEADVAATADGLGPFNYIEYTPNTTLQNGLYLISDYGTTCLLDSQTGTSVPYYGPAGTAIASTLFRMGAIRKNGGIWLQRYYYDSTKGWVADDMISGGISGWDGVVRYIRFGAFYVG